MISDIKFVILVNKPILEHNLLSDTMYKTVILLLFASLHMLVGAQPSISIRPMPLATQLPSNSVHRVFQDKEGFMWFGTLDGLSRYDGYRLLTFRSDANNPDLLMSNEITCIAEDQCNNVLIGTKKGFNILNKSTYIITSLNKEELNEQNIKCIHVSKGGSIWVGTSKGLFRYNPDFTIAKDFRNALPANDINYIYEDNENNLWVMMWRGGLFKYDQSNDNFDKLPSIGKTNNPFRMYQDDKNNYWVCTWGDGLYRYNPHTKNDEAYTPYNIINKESGMNEERFFGIIQDNTYGFVWLMSASGVYALTYASDNRVKEVEVSYLFKELNNIFSDIIKDNTGNLWIGSFSEGVFSINFDKTLVKNYPMPAIKEKTGIASHITTLFEDNNGNIWINQNRWGLGVYNPQTDQVKFYREYPSLCRISDMKFISCISSDSRDNRNVWVGSENHPLIYVLRKEKEDIRVVEEIHLNRFGIAVGNPRRLFKDRKDNTWILTTNSLVCKPHFADTLIQVNADLQEITDITEDIQGNIWVSCRTKGIVKIPVRGNIEIDLSQIAYYNQENSMLKSDNVETIFADTNGKIWIGSSEGSILVYDIISGAMEDITPKFNMIGEGIFNILSDDYGHIWISTNKRIVEFNPRSNAIKEYMGTDDDVLVNSFLVNSYFKNRKGEILYGGNKGISVFTPSNKLAEDPESPPVYITDVKINNQSLLKGNDNRKFDLLNRTLTFEPDDKNIEIDFSSLYYSSPHKIRYAYKLEKVDDNWVYTGPNRQFAVYNQLKKGKHVFSVRAMDENGLWDSQLTRLTIYKRPAIYETWWAFLIYIVLAFFLIRLLYVSGRNRLKLKNDLKIAQIEREKSEELTQTKLRYFTNITHDFLTPLTILSCLVDDAEITYQGKITQFDAMRSSIYRLRRLLQQVLDFRKVESGNMKLKISNGDIVLFIRDVCYTNFLPLMKKKNITFTFDSTPFHIQAWFDADKIDKIVFNLLSNAFKYTPEHGKVSVNLNKYTTGNGSHLSIKVKDSGIGISQEDIDKIFTRFYSNKINEAGDSNGIGLNLTKDLVEIHRGQLQVESTAGQGSLFIVDIPINKEFYSESELHNNIIILDEKDTLLTESSIQENISTINQDTGANEENKTPILLVEDNEELLSLMFNILSKQYHVHIAKNGLEGVGVLKEQEIDIVISDVMMPEMDGLELCRTIKKDIETSHIPVILLTAKNSTEDRIECYNAGADGYISKPFELKVLNARINNFITNKKVKQKEFQTNEVIDITSLEYPSIDQEFLKKSVEIIEKYLADSEFNINIFADEMFLSKSTLYRKIKMITGMSPIEFIRNIRLKHACQILKNQSISISEVAYLVGFSDPNYFSQCFKNEFNITPKDYRKI